MLCLLTGNPAKYAPLAELLEQLQIVLQKPAFELPELQESDALAVLARKARLACEAQAAPCLVDDSGLWLDAYPGFPGPLTRLVCNALGAAGMERLVAGVSPRGRMVCHLGCWVGGRLWHWRGEVEGRLDPRRPAGGGAGPLTQWFVPDAPGENAVFLHRRRALEALGRDIGRLRQALADGLPEASCTPGSRNAECVFCQEIDGHASSIYHELLGREIPSRVIHSTPRFLVFPPLGQFIEGGLLIVTREHRISMAQLPAGDFDELERLTAETAALLREHYGCRPVFFEHAPLSAGEKGTCCVDHAHWNVFPANVDVHRHLKKLPHARIGALEELGRGFRDRAYLFLQTNEGDRFVYDAGVVPSQYVRKIITAELGMPERWHWREYLGLEELKRTLATLAGWRRPHVPSP
jgi:inosine/xanthosine triphosphate pyrophosphatase family protein/diadenosine tetraphosphate (Ap4A) HIT family hydrolase